MMSDLTPRPAASSAASCSPNTIDDLVNVPKFVWHADVNIGQRDCVVVNFPTTPYDHVNPDKYRLPLDTPLIPYSLAGYRGF